MTCGRSTLTRVVLKWLPLAVAITLVSLVIYLAVQQGYRMSANDPQIQMAEDAATRLAADIPAQSIVGTGVVEIGGVRGSLAPYLVVFDDGGRPVASSMRLDGRTPTLPAGVFDYARRHGEDRITWQPRPGVRGAIVVVRHSGRRAGFVLAGRSLREVEVREHDLTLQVLAGLLVTLFATLIAVAFIETAGSLFAPRPPAGQ